MPRSKARMYTKGRTKGPTVIPRTQVCDDFVVVNGTDSPQSPAIFPPRWEPSNRKEHALSFLDLPRELRDIIYKHCVPVRESLAIDVRYPTVDIPYPPFGCRSKRHNVDVIPYINIALMQICRQLHNEVAEILYRMNTFVVRCAFGRSFTKWYHPKKLEFEPWCIPPQIESVASAITKNPRLPTMYAHLIQNLRLLYVEDEGEPVRLFWRQVCEDVNRLEKGFKNLVRVTVVSYRLDPIRFYEGQEVPSRDQVVMDIMQWMKQVVVLDGTPVPRTLQLQFAHREWDWETDEYRDEYAVPDMPVQSFEEALVMYRDQYPRRKLQRRVIPA
jgi:hypothetical protein